MTRRIEVDAIAADDGSKATVGKMMAAFSLDAVDHAARNGRTLDFSEGSLHDVEALLAGLHNSIPGGFTRLLKRGPSPADIETVAKMYGGYIGYVMKFEWGEGDWILVEEGPFAGAICLAYGKGALTSPPSKAYKRIVDGPADDIWFYYQVLSQGRHEKAK